MRNGRSPAEETIGVIPFARSVLVKTVRPALFVVQNGNVETLQDGRFTYRTQVRGQARDGAGGAAKSALEVHLFRRIKVPRHDLAEYNLVIRGMGENAVAKDRRTAADERKDAWITIVHFGRADANHHGFPARHIEISRDM